MLAQGVLGFQYEAEPSTAGLTSLGGLPLYLDLIHGCGLAEAIRQHAQVAGAQGWLPDNPPPMHFSSGYRATIWVRNRVNQGEKL